jgi:hypothetical protein
LTTHADCVGTVSILAVAAIGGDFFGMHDDNMYHIPSNISIIVDLLRTSTSRGRLTRRTRLPMNFMASSNDTHDTTIDFTASFPEYWLLTDPRANDDETLILLTFDETDVHDPE